MLVVFTATIKNPEKRSIRVSSSQTFGLRVYDTTFQAADISYRLGVDSSLGNLDTNLKSGASMDIVAIYEFPESLPHLRVGVYYNRYNKAQTPKYDLSSLIDTPTSVFAKNKLNFNNSASAKVGAMFDLDDLNFRVVDCQPIENNGFRVRVEIKNPMLRPGRWGFQYAKATLTDESGNETASYPEFYPTSGYEAWGNEIGAGRTVVGDYKFYPTGRGAPKSFKLTTMATKRSVTVSGL